jgi:mRNA turnover protein 4
MPRSKRNKLVSLSKVKSGGKERKETLIAKVRKAAEKYQSLYVFRMSNSRSQLVQDIRDSWADSKIFFGKNKVG